LSYPSPRKATNHPATQEEYAGVVVPLQLAAEDGILNFFSATTIFGTPVDITLVELGCCDARAAEVLTRTDYIRYLIRLDLEQSAGKSRRRRFASRDLIGKFNVGSGSTNASVRRALAARRTRNSGAR
jgi:hypothetical protein